MTAATISGRMGSLMIYALVLVMLFAGCILALGYAGRDTGPDQTHRDDA